MTDIGKKLEGKRKGLGYDYEYVYQKTKIHPRILQALEKDDFEYFTSPLYLKSFLRKYAEFLQLDSTILLQEVEEFLSQKKRKLSPGVTSLSLLPPGEKLLLGVKILFSFIITLLVIYFVFVGIGKTLSFIIPHKVSPRTSIKIKKEEKALRPGLIKISQGEKKSLKIKGPLRLTLEAKEDCWLQLRADNEKIFEGILKKGQRETWKANKGFELWVGEASRLNVILNGVPLGPLGRGIIKGIKIDASGLKLP